MQYEIDEESDASPDGFFRVFPTLDVETYKAEIQGRDIDGLRLIIGDDWDRMRRIRIRIWLGCGYEI